MADDVFRIVGSTQAGAYRVQDVVAEGGFAVVYRAYHEAFRAAVALKCLKIPGTLSPQHQAEFLERFREEAELLFRLSASIPSVVRPLHVGTLDTPTRSFVPFIALEWLEGTTLDRLIADRREKGLAPLSPKAAVFLLSPVARALEKAHHFRTEKGEIAILHRDLKPENIFVAKAHGTDTTKILDFGIGTVKSAATQIVGKQSAGENTLAAFTPGYGAPEQWLPKRFGQTGRWTDVWGLALTVVEAWLGHPPLEGDHAAMMGAAIDEQRRPTPRNEGLEVTDEVERVFLKALAVDPRNRYHEVENFWNDLCSGLGMKRPTFSVPVPAMAPTDPPKADPHAGTQPMAPADGKGVPRVPTLIVAGNGQAPPASAPSNAGRQSAPGSNPRGAPGSDPRAAPPPAPKPRAPTAREPDPALSGAQAYMLGNTIDAFDDDAPGEILAVPPSLDHLDGVGLSPRPAPVRAQPMRAAGSRDAMLGTGAATVRAKFRLPIQIVLVGIVVMVADFAYGYFAGDVFRLGPIRPVMVAGPLVVLGLGIGLARLFGSGPE